MNVKLAIPIWNGRVSPVMDSAGRLLTAEYVDGRERSRAVVDLPRASVDHLTRFISELGIDTLICGALSLEFNQMLTASGIKTYPWYRGDVEEVIAAYLSGCLQQDDFKMPGYGRRRRGMGRRCGRGPGCGPAKWMKEEQ